MIVRKKIWETQEKYILRNGELREGGREKINERNEGRWWSDGKKEVKETKQKRASEGRREKWEGRRWGHTQRTHKHTPLGSLNMTGDRLPFFNAAIKMEKRRRRSGKAARSIKCLLTSSSETEHLRKLHPPRLTTDAKLLTTLTNAD